MSKLERGVFSQVFTEIAVEKGINPKSNQAIDTLKEIYLNEFEILNDEDKESLYNDISMLKGMMKEWICEHHTGSIDNDE